MRSARLLMALAVISAAAAATIFGDVRGLIHDPQHRPVQGAQVTIKAANSDWSQSGSSDDRGQFQFSAVPLGSYTVSVHAPGFSAAPQNVLLASGSAVNLHFQLAMAAAAQTVEVSGEPEAINAESATAQTFVSRQQILETPGADRANSLAMITTFVPSATVVHDQLHIRGGHQSEWLLDGVPVPNTNIASNVGPQFDPKDIASIEVQRGGYSAEYGDRAYGVFNVVTQSGFERNKEGELAASFGSFNATNDQVSFGSHSDRFAYFTSLSGYRTDAGLETPQTQILHDLASGGGVFGSIIFNRTPGDQLRLVASARTDHYQAPNTSAQQGDGVRDVESEYDSFANFTWVHTSARGVTFTLSPFYHFNRAHYLGEQRGLPAAWIAPRVIPDDDRGSHYGGGVAAVNVVRGKHNFRAGLQGFAQHDNRFLSLNDPQTGVAFRDRARLWGDLEALFVEDQYKPLPYLTLTGGVRLTHFAGGVSQTAADPRVGAALRLPSLNWVLRAFYGRYYQAPPLLTVSGPLLGVAVQQGFGFLPLRGEKDEQREFGVEIPVHGWALEISNFRTAARNYFDHEVLGNSNVFFPLTLERARIRGWEASVRSAQMGKRARLHLAYSHQYAQARGGVTGGLTEFGPPANGGYYFLDHDQRNTLSAGVNVTLPWRSWASSTVSYGSGLLDGDGPGHLQPHTTGDFAAGKSIGEAWSVRLSVLNVTNHRYLIDNSNTFGGTHYAEPREISFQLRYRFHY